MRPAYLCTEIPQIHICIFWDRNSPMHSAMALHDEEKFRGAAPSRAVLYFNTLTQLVYNWILMRKKFNRHWKMNCVDDLNNKYSFGRGLMWHLEGYKGNIASSPDSPTHLTLSLHIPNSLTCETDCDNGNECFLQMLTKSPTHHWLLTVSPGIASSLQILECLPLPATLGFTRYGSTTASSNSPYQWLLTV